MSRAQLTSTDQQNSGGAVSPYVAGKNKVINGDFNIWQRGTSFTPAGGSVVYTADRFFVVVPSGSTVSRQPFTAGTAPVAGYENQYYMNTTITANAQNYECDQKIENARTFAGQTATFSFWARSTVGAQTMNILIQQNFGTGGSPSSTTDGTLITSSTGNGQYTPTSSWTRYWFTFSLASVSGKTFGTNNDSYLLIRPFQFTTTATNTSIDIWGVQLEAGSVATPFTTASGTLQGELAAAQRYYQKSYNIDVNPGTSTNVGATTFLTSMLSSYQYLPTTYLRTQMRATPTVTIYSTTGASAKIRDQSQSTDLNVATQQTGSSAFSAYVNNVSVSAGDDLRFQWTADIEL
jgi:hypothetical protein